MFERNPPPHLTRAPLKKEELHEFYLDRSDDTYHGYMIATKDMLPSLQHMLNTATSFKQLKKELTAFIQDRQDFIDYDMKTPVPDRPR